MSRILKSKKVATKFQILVEVASNQPNVQQKEIAKKIEITPQAVSEYIKELIKDGFVNSDGRSMYNVTNEGVDWALKMLRELEEYSEFVGDAIKNITISTAIADLNISKGQSVSLEMKDGLLYASKVSHGGAKGVAVSDAKIGDEVGIRNVEGIMDLDVKKIVIFRVPNVKDGGSREVDPGRLREAVKRASIVGAIGIEGIVALRRIDYSPGCIYGTVEAAIEASRSGLSFLIVCVEDEVSMVVKRLDEKGLAYEVLGSILER
ncbi:MAG: winged helix-turn-helix transcriptional regulator [Halobacteriota archaeon]|nr:winged helix-turn-helix transcriptional regulator [Halobacteriota archaeon]